MHAAYDLELFEDIVLNRHPQADGPGSFAPSEVDEAGWAAQQARLFAVAGRVAVLMRANPSWPEPHVRSAFGSLVHLAYHLGGGAADGAGGRGRARRLMLGAPSARSARRPARRVG